jgi:sugar phosphate isomerase/epimerase
MLETDYSRRKVLKTIGAGTLALALPRFNALARPAYKPKIALQLYSIRRQIEKDFDGSIRRIAAMGFEGIETYALPESVPLEHAAKVFRDAGLKVTSMHTELPAGDKRDGVLKLAEAYVYDEASAFLKSKGLRFGLHNHWWEFELTDGITPYYYLLDHVSKDVVFEVDTYWAKTGGQDPAKVVKRFGKRAPLLHIKDGPAIKGDEALKQVPAGDGVMDFPAIVRAGGTNIKWMIVEFDEYANDIFDGIQKSYTYLTKNGLAEGKV